MALDYDLRIKSKLSFYEKVDSYLSTQLIIYEKIYTDKIVKFDLFERLGFVITCLNSTNFYFDYLVSEFESVQREWDYSSIISFRLEKDYDYVKVSLNMLDIIQFILKDTTQDAILIFNGDVMILERENGKIIINKEMGFKNSKELVEKMNELIY